MAGEAGADRVDAGGDKGDVDGDIDGDVDRNWDRFIVAPIADHALGDVMLDARHNAVRDTLSDSEARTVDGAGGLNPADGKPPRGVDHKVRRENSAKTRAQRSEPFQSLRHACGHWRIEPKGTDRRIAGRAGAIERRCLPTLLCLLGVPFETHDPRARLPVEAGLPTETYAFECGGSDGCEERRPGWSIAVQGVGLVL